MNPAHLRRDLLAAWQAWRALVRSRISSPYRFDVADVRLHLNERAWRPEPPRSLEVDGDAVRLAIGGSEFWWPRSFSRDGLAWVHAEVFQPWVENPASYDHPAASVPRGGWVVDAGACEGFFGMFALERGAAQVMAVEPVPALQATLRRTFRAAIAEERLDVFPGALAGRTGPVRLAWDDAHAWDARTTDGGAGQEAPGTTLDDLVGRWAPRGQGLVKMDVEGGEMDALDGAREVLRDRKPRLAIAVYHGHENALRCRERILASNPAYHVEFRGIYAWVDPPRPYLLFAW